jgi:hypothetical protein
MTACIQNQIIHKHVHMDYNPLNCQLYPIQPFQKVEVTRGPHLPIPCEHVCELFDFECMHKNDRNVYVLKDFNNFWL